MSRLGVPNKLRDFLEYCGCDTEHFTKSDRAKKEAVLTKLSRQFNVTSRSVAEVTGTEMILRERKFSRKENFDKVGDGDPDCNKDTEGVVTMNCYSRGHVFFVHGGGIIRYWYHISIIQ